MLDGSISLSVINPDPGAPNTIIETDNTWTINVDWHLTGFVAPAVGGDWKVTAYLEAFDGGSSPGAIGSKVVALSTALPSLNRHYQASIAVAAGAVRAGLFKLNVAITYSNLGVPLEMAGYIEGQLLQFFDPGPLPDALGQP